VGNVRGEGANALALKTAVNLLHCEGSDDTLSCVYSHEIVGDLIGKDVIAVRDFLSSLEKCPPIPATVRSIKRDPGTKVVTGFQVLPEVCCRCDCLGELQLNRHLSTAVCRSASRRWFGSKMRTTSSERACQTQFLWRLSSKIW
jgi:hypothetical protein